MKKVRFSTRFWGLALVVALLVSVLAGCATQKTAAPTQGGDKPAVTTTKAPASTTAATTEDVTLAPVELSWYILETAENLGDLDEVIARMNEITEPEINATLKLVTFDGASFADKIKLMIQGGEEFDMCFTSNWLNPYTVNAAKGAYVALDDLLEEYGPNVRNTVPDKYWDVARVGGKIYGMLNYQVFAQRNGFLIKKDLAEKYGLDVDSIKKVEDIEPFLEEVMQNEQGLAGIVGSSIPNQYDPTTGALLDFIIGDETLPIYVAADDPTFTAKNYAESDAYKEKIERARRWYQKGYIRKDALTAWADQTADINAGKYAAMLNVGTMKPGYIEEWKTLRGLDLVGIPMETQVASAASILGTLTAVSVTSKNPERAVMYYNMLYGNPELYNTLIFGIEDKHYTKIEHNVVEQIPDSGYKFSNAWEVGNQFNAYYRKGSIIGIWDETIKYNAEAFTSPIISFNFDQEPVKSEIAQIQAVAQEYDPQFNVGVADLDKVYPEYLNKLQAAGIDKVIAEAQAQLDAWKAGQ